MQERGLRKIGIGFYVNAEGGLLVNVREILVAFEMSDTPEVRQALWDQIRQDFGLIPIEEIEDEGG